MNKKTIDIVVAVAKQGGVETVINIVAQFLEQHNYNVRLIQMVYEGDEWFYNKNNFFYLLTSRYNQSDRSFIDAYKLFTLKNGKPDVMIATGWPVMVWICRNVCVELNLTVNVISWTHNDIDRYVSRNYGGLEFLAMADINLVLTNSMYQQVKACNTESLIYNIGNPVMINDNYNKETKYKNSLVFIGRLDPDKHVDILIKAIAQCKNIWNLLIIGDGDNLESLVQLSHHEGVSDRITWLGWVDNPKDYISDYYALVIASDSEGFCLAAIEASERGLVVISTPVGIIPEYIKPGYNGYLFEKGNYTMLAQILDYIAEDKLPRLNRTDCHDSIIQYDKNLYLESIKTIIELATN